MAKADQDTVTDAGNGKWIISFSLPDSYLPPGFIYDPQGHHFIFKRVDPGCEDAYCRLYFIGADGHCANYELFAKPSDENSPVGYGNTNFTPRRIGSLDGYWNQNFESESSIQSTFVFKIGSCVMGLYVDASQASAKSSRARYPRPSPEQVLQTYEQFFVAFHRYINDRGWVNLEGTRKKPNIGPAASGDQPVIQTQPPVSTPPLSPEDLATVPPVDTTATEGDESNTGLDELTPAEIATAGGPCRRHGAARFAIHAGCLGRAAG